MGLIDEKGNPVSPVYTDGKYAVPTLTDADGNVLHEGEHKEGMSTGAKVALAGAGLAGGTAATAVGVHYYKKKKTKKPSGDKKSKDKGEKGDKKDKKDKKDKGDKDKKEKGDKKDKKDKKDKGDKDKKDKKKK